MTPREAPSPRGPGATSSCATCSLRATSHSPYTTRAPPRRCLRPRTSMRPASRRSKARVGYFTSWVQQQVVERYGAPRAFDGACASRPRSTRSAGAAEQAINNYLADPSGPSASLVAIRNATGEVRAMVVGRSYARAPSICHQRGSASPVLFKAFDLAAALESGISPESTWPPAEAVHRADSPRPEKFVSTTTKARTPVQHAARRHRLLRQLDLRRSRAESRYPPHRPPGARDGDHHPAPTNPAMTIGGSRSASRRWTWRTPTRRSRRRPAVSGTAGEDYGPVSLQQVDAGTQTLPDGAHRDVDHVITKPGCRHPWPPRDLDARIVVQYGTGRAARSACRRREDGHDDQYGDAWFVGWDGK